MSPNAQLTDGGPPLGCGLPAGFAGPPFGEAFASAGLIESRFRRNCTARLGCGIANKSATAPLPEVRSLASLSLNQKMAFQCTASTPL